MLIVAVVQIERVRRVPLVPLQIFKRPGLSPAYNVAFLMQGGYVGWQFMTTLFLQNAVHCTPIEVGLMFAPSEFIVMLTARPWFGLVSGSARGRSASPGEG